MRKITEEQIYAICKNRPFGLNPKQESVELMVKVIKVLSEEGKNLTVSQAQAILNDVITVLPMLTTI